MSLQSRLVLRFLIAFVAVTASLFIPAGSFKFWQGWAFLAIWFVPGLIAFVYFYKRDPELIKRRLQRKEKIREQKVIMKFFYATELIAFLLPGLDYRFRWSRVPPWLTVVALAGVVSGYAIVFWVMKVNTFAASTIQVEAGQKVISTGPYGLVRHPMYLGICIMLICAPLALGSYVALVAFALIIPLSVMRLLNEERLLLQELPGYDEYRRHTRFRLVPFVW